MYSFNIHFRSKRLDSSFQTNSIKASSKTVSYDLSSCISSSRSIDLKSLNSISTTMCSIPRMAFQNRGISCYFLYLNFKCIYRFIGSMTAVNPPHANKHPYHDKLLFFCRLKGYFTILPDHFDAVVEKIIQ